MQLSHLAQRLFTDRAYVDHAILEILGRFGAAALTKTYEHGIRITLLKPHETYRRHSTTLRRLALDVDRWPTPPAGLFVVEERAMLIRRVTAMTIAHEFGHAIDCVLGGGVYHSNTNPSVKHAFAHAARWITPYAATRIDEYFAEGLRSYVEANDRTSPWPYATRERLARYDPQLYSYVRDLFARNFAV